MKKVISIFLILPFAFQLAKCQNILNDFFETNGTINTTLVKNNRLYVGGNFDYVGTTTGCFAGFDFLSPDSFYFPANLVGKVNTAVYDATNNLIYIGGDFKFNNQQKYIMVLGTGETLPTQPNIAPNGPVNKMKISGNTLYMLGSFTSINNQVRSGIAAINLSTKTLTSFNPSIIGVVKDIDVLGSNIFICGAFTSVNDQQRNNIATLDLTGNTNSLNIRVRGLVNAIAVRDSLLFLGGLFDSVGGVFRRNLASVNINTGQTRSNWINNTDGEILTLGTDNQNVYAGGIYSSVNNTIVVSNFAAFNLNTGLKTGLNVLANGKVDHVKIQNNQIFISGDFDMVGTEKAKGFALLSATGSVVPTALTNDKVLDLVWVGSRYYYAGLFSSAGGSPVSNLAAFDITTGNLEPFVVNIDGEVKQLVDLGSELIVAGSFNFINNFERKGIAIIDTVNGTPNSWNVNCNGSINSIILQGTTIYVAGKFTFFGQTQRNNLASINILNGQPTSWNPNVNDEVEKMIIHGSILYIYGKFNNVGTTTRNRFASFNLINNGSLRNLSLQINNSINDMIVYQNKLLLTGNFNNVNNTNLSTGFVMIDTLSGTLVNNNINYIGVAKSLNLYGGVLLVGGSVSNSLNNTLLAYDISNGEEIQFPLSFTDGSHVEKVHSFLNLIMLSGKFTIDNDLGKSNFVVINVISSTPTVSASNITVSELTPVSARISFKKGNGTKRIVLAKIDSNVNAVPLNGNMYSANSRYGDGANIQGNFVVHNSADTTFELTGLNFGTKYHLAVFEYNGFGNFTNYLTSNLARDSFTTLIGYNAPTVSASNLQVYDIRVTSFKLRWAKGNGQKRLVVVKQGSAVDATPKDSFEYFSNSTFTFGDALGNNNFVVYNGDGDSCEVNGLTSQTNYHFAVYEYNGFNVFSKYRLTSPATGNATTLQKAPIPTQHSQNISITNITSNEATISWTSGNGSSRIVIVSDNGSLNARPTDGEIYFSDNNFNGVSSYLSVNERVLYVGNGNTVNIKGLKQFTNYKVAVIEYNGTLYTSSYFNDGFEITNFSTPSFVAKPTQPSRQINMVKVTSDSCKFNWQKGNGDFRLVIMKKANAIISKPQDRVYYFYSNTFLLGDILPDGSSVVGNGDINEIEVSGLEPNTLYFIAVYEYNESLGEPIYFTDSFATRSFLTPPLTNIKNTKGLNNQMKIYPNPSNNQNIVLEAEAFETDKIKIELYSIDGTEHLVQYEKTKNTIVIQTTKLASGSYFLKVIDDNNTIVRKIQIDNN